MRRSALALMLLAVMAVPGVAWAQGVQIAPQKDEDLQSILEGLARRHAVSRWCESDCASFFEVRLAGRLASGELSFEARGSVVGTRTALVRLFGMSAVRELSEARDGGGKSVPLYWVGDAYAAVLQPGEFTLRGVVRFERGAALTVKVPGPAGLVTLDVADAEVAGTGERRGVVDGTYQLAPTARRDEPEAASERRLRLEVRRSFELARDKSFSVTVHARGARAGQVIPIQLATGEQVEGFDESLGRVVGEGDAKRIEWVAPGPEATLSYGGKWTEPTIELLAPSGAAHETWAARCDDPYECSFDGDAELAPGNDTRVWSPLPGQRLKVSWRELTPLAGIHTAAHVVTVVSRPVGDNLKQTAEIDWQSSSGSLVSVALPQGASVSRFMLDGVDVPMLKDEQGALRVTLPAARSRLRMEWELAGVGGLLVPPPVPKISAPIGTLWHDVRPAEGRTVLLAGGMAGSPRVELWPNLGAALLVALLVWQLARAAGAPVASTWMWIVAALGFAVTSPLLSLPLVLVFAATRWLGRIRRERGRLRIVLELGVLSWVTLPALAALLFTLDAALLGARPIDVSSFVQAPALAGVEWSPNLAWGVYLAPHAGELAAPPSPWVLMVPTVLLRFVWAGWAIVVAMLLLREGREALAALGRYWSTAGWRRPSSTAKPPPLAT